MLGVDVADDANAAALHLSVMEDGIHFNRNDTLINPHIGSRLPHVVDRTDFLLIREVIRRFIHFNYHLIRMGRDGFRNVYMELKRLKTEYINFDQTLTPVGNNFIEINELARLGMTIYNRTDLPLYPYLATSTLPILTSVSGILFLNILLMRIFQLNGMHLHWVLRPEDLPPM